MNEESNLQDFIASELEKLYSKNTNKFIKIETRNFLRYYDYIIIDDYFLFYKLIDDHYTFEIIKNVYDIHFNLGVELETCLDITNSNEIILNKIESLINFLSNTFYPTLSNSFIQKQKFIYIELENRYIEYNLISNSFKTVYNYKNNYQYIILTKDGSIRCDRENRNLLPIEIVTNINNNINDLFEILEVFNPFSKPNESKGFHINISLNDKNNNRIKLIDPLLFELVKLWLPYERENYLKIRKEITNYAKPLYSIYDEDEIEMNEINENYQSNELENDYYKQFDTKENKKIFEIISSINSDKYLSFTNYKNINVLEFRLFEAKKDLSKLKDYISDIIIILYKTISNYFTFNQFIQDRYLYLFNKYKYYSIGNEYFMCGHTDNFDFKYRLIMYFFDISYFNNEYIDFYFYRDPNKIKIYQIKRDLVDEFIKKSKLNYKKIKNLIFKNMKFIKYTTITEIANT